MKSLKTLVIYIFLVCVILSLPRLCSAAGTSKIAADELKKKEQELNSLYQKLSSHKKELEKTKKQEENVIQRLVIINHELKQTKSQLGRAKEQIDRNESRISFLKTSMEQAKKQLDDQSNVLRSRVREIYKTGGVNYVEMFLSSDTLADFINRSYYFEKVIGTDVNVVTNIQNEHKRIKSDKEELEGVTVGIKQLKQEIEQKKQYITQQAEEKKKVYEALETKRVEYEKEIAALEDTSKQMETMIRQQMAKGSKVVGKGSGSFIWPVRGRITSPFGYRRSPFSGRTSMHTGLDIATSYGTPIQAADSGAIIFAGWWDGYGKAVIISHGSVLSTVYGHMSRILVQKGDQVAKGQVIGLIGSTGYSTGPHCHFEVRKNGVPQNPIRYLP